MKWGWRSWRSRLHTQLLAQPEDGRTLVGHDQGQLLDLCRLEAQSVVLTGLHRQEEHAISLGVALAQAGVELGRAQGHGQAALDVEGHHAVEEHVDLAFIQYLQPAFFDLRNRQVAQVLLGEVPRPCLAPGLVCEPLLEGVVGL